MGIFVRTLFVLMVLLLPLPLLAQQAKPTLAPLCAGCHKPEPNMLMGLLDNISLKGDIIQLDLTTHKEIVKFTASTKLKDVNSFEEMRQFRGRAFTIYYTEKKGEKTATSIARFDILRTLKPEDKLTKDDFKKLMAERKDLVIVDSRPAPRYEEGHIPWAIVIPAAVLEKQTDKLPKEKDRLLVFYCVGGCSSPIAAVKAKSLGYTNVKIYIGGMPDWVQTEYTHTTPKWLKDAIEKDIPHILIDTSSKDIAHRGHIKGAISTTPDELDKMKEQFPKDRMAPIVLYGDKGVEMAQKIIGWGYRGVRILPITYDAWKAAGNPIATGHTKTTIVYVPKPKPGTIPHAEFRKMAAVLPPDTVIIDVRNADEYAAGHVKGAMNIPLDELNERYTEIPKGKRVILYCDRGLRAEMGYHILAEKGFNVSCLDATVKAEKDGTFTIVE